MSTVGSSAGGECDVDETCIGEEEGKVVGVSALGRHHSIARRRRSGATPSTRQEHATRRTEANWFLFDFIDNTNCSALRREREPGGGGEKSPGYFFLFFFFHSHLKLGKHRCP